MSDLGRGCTFCGRHRSDVDGRMITLQAVVPEDRSYPVISVCWACLDRPISHLVTPLGVFV